MSQVCPAQTCGHMQALRSTPGQVTRYPPPIQVQRRIQIPAPNTLHKHIAKTHVIPVVTKS